MLRQEATVEENRAAHPQLSQTLLATDDHRLHRALHRPRSATLHPPAILGHAIDNALGVRESRFSVRTALLIIGLSLVQGIFTFMRAYLFQWLAEAVGYDLRNDLYDKFQQLPFSFYDQAQTAS